MPERHRSASSEEIDEFIARLRVEKGSDAASAAERIVRWAESHGVVLQKERATGAFLFLNFGTTRCEFRPIDINPNGNLEILLTRLGGSPSHFDADRIAKLRKSLDAIDSETSSRENPRGWTWFPLARLTTDDRMNQFEAILDWLHDESSTVG